MGRSSSRTSHALHSHETVVVTRMLRLSGAEGSRNGGKRPRKTPTAAAPDSRLGRLARAYTSISISINGKQIHKKHAKNALLHLPPEKTNLETWKANCCPDLIDIEAAVTNKAKCYGLKKKKKKTVQRRQEGTRYCDSPTSMSFEITPISKKNVNPLLLASK